MTGIKLANNIRAERNRKRISMVEVASNLGVSYGTYQNYEADATNVSVIQLLKLAELFECNINDFFID